jgi:glycosyltransferase involved in cell wall biosynthesis
MSNNKEILTIAIPTYNRNEILKRNLKLLLPQLTDQTIVNIYDNCSDIPVAETLKEEEENYKNLKIFRNKANIGLSGNIIKCIEECTSKWVWILSDDDATLPTTVSIINDYIKSFPDANCINFKSEFNQLRISEVTTKGPY